MKFLRALILSVAIVTGSTGWYRLFAAPDSLWQQVEASLQREDRQKTIGLLRLSVFAATNLEESEPLLYSMLGQSVEEILADSSVHQLDPQSLEEVYNLQSELAQLGVATQSDWKLLLDIALAFPQPDRFIVAGQQFLNYFETDDDLSFDQDWLELLKGLEENLNRGDQALYRLRLCKMLVAADGANEDFKSRLADARIFAEAQAVSILELARVAIFMGDLEVAASYIEQVRSYDPNYLGVEEITQKLQLAIRLEKRLITATEAFSRRKYQEAEKICREILERDPSNLGATRILQQIEDVRERPAAQAVSDRDRLTLQLRRLNAELREAEKQHDLIAVRKALKELLLLRKDSEYIGRLEEVEHEISMSRLHARERFGEAIKLFETEQYHELLRFLNRNPGLMSSMDRLVEVWEMRLMANYYAGLLDRKELARSASNILEKAGASFYANYVLVRLAIADNDMVTAHKYYQSAAAIKPDHPLLKMPGLLLWVHGEGRIFAVIALIILLFCAAKLIGPIIRLYEKTWWTRVRLISYLFPSLAIASIERSFSQFKGEKEQVRLFTLLKKCAVKTGDKKKLAIYTQNLMRLLKPDEQDLKEVNAARESSSESESGSELAHETFVAESPVQPLNNVISAREIMAQKQSIQETASDSENLSKIDEEQVQAPVNQRLQNNSDANIEQLDDDYYAEESGAVSDDSGIESALKQVREQLFGELNGITCGAAAVTDELTAEEVKNKARQMFSQLD